MCLSCLQSIMYKLAFQLAITDKKWLAPATVLSPKMATVTAKFSDWYELMGEHELNWEFTCCTKPMKPLAPAKAHSTLATVCRTLQRQCSEDPEHTPFSEDTVLYAQSLPTFDAPKVEMPSMPSFSASPPRVNRRGAVDATRRRLGALDSLIALRAGSQARRPLHAVVLDAEIRRESLRMNQIVAACLTHRSMCAQAPEAPSFKMPDAPKLPDAPKMDMPSFSASHQCIKHIVVSYRAQRTHWLIC